MIRGYNYFLFNCFILYNINIIKSIINFFLFYNNS